ncbi:MAG: hypothetical protein H3C56_10105 [Chitinophagaceae bacterium]|nr:hypothetical protein [Chitinophagaceae bacterium]
MNTTTDIVQIEKYSKKELVEFIRYLIQNDFEKLVFLLYRIDVYEDKIKKLLNTSINTNAEELIAQAIMERLEEKRISREKYKTNTSLDEEEKW